MIARGLWTMAFLAPALVPAHASGQAVCVTNGSERAHFFAAETRGGPRVTGWLDPAGVLCSDATEGQAGVVSVFESEDHQEGCSRLVPGPETETLLKYVDFDRCFWASNTN